MDDPATDAYGWLAKARELEAAAGRVRDMRWGLRTLDVDVIDVDGIVNDDPELTLPHPRAYERAFVLLPWAEVEPDRDLPAVDPAGVRKTDLALR